jgi:hypothetical protein
MRTAQSTTGTRRIPAQLAKLFALAVLGCGSPAARGNPPIDGGLIDVDVDIPAEAATPEGSSSAGCGTYTSGIPACDDCIHTSCCPEALACDTADDGGVNPSGLTRCEQLFDCILVCAAGKPDSGVAPPSYGACENTCRPGFTGAQQLNVMGLDTCIGLLCSTPCMVQTP